MSLQRLLNKTPEQIANSNPQELEASFENILRDRNSSFIVNPYFNPLKALSIGIAVGFGTFLITRK